MVDYFKKWFKELYTKRQLLLRWNFSWSTLCKAKGILV